MCWPASIKVVPRNHLSVFKTAGNQESSLNGSSLRPLSHKNREVELVAGNPSHTQGATDSRLPQAFGALFELNFSTEPSRGAKLTVVIWQRVPGECLKNGTASAAR